MSLKEKVQDEFDVLHGAGLLAALGSSGFVLCRGGIPESVLDVSADTAVLGVGVVAALFLFWGLTRRSEEMVHGTAHV